MGAETKRFAVVVGVDYSEHGDEALETALLFAGPRPGAELHVVSVKDGVAAGALAAAGASFGESANQADLEKLRTHVSRAIAASTPKLTAPLTARAIVHLRRGDTANAIAQLAADVDADLVIVGTHGRRGVERFFLGSVAERLVRLARCPVWVVRPKDHEGLGKVPEIEPPCPQCLAKQRETNGSQMWCTRHSEHHIRAHTYAYVEEQMTSGESSGYSSSPIA